MELAAHPVQPRGDGGHRRVPQPFEEFGVVEGVLGARGDHLPLQPQPGQVGLGRLAAVPRRAEHQPDPVAEGVERLRDPGAALRVPASHAYTLER